jgi:hypothetical protein
MTQNHIFIGYDEREKDPYNVCVQSLKDSSKYPDRIKTHPLFHRELRDLGLFDRPWTITPEGTYEDQRDGRPFSVQFSHSRFLTPTLARLKGIDDVVMFCDCDFLFQQDVNKLFDFVRSRRKQFPVQVVKHDYKPQNTLKMDNSVQQQYNKKLWSAMMFFDTSHPAVKERLTPDVVNHATGSFLHSFQWVGDESLIGEIPETWQFVGNHSEVRTGLTIDEAACIHYTEGGPWFRKYENCPGAHQWLKTFYHHTQQTVPR